MPLLRFLKIHVYLAEEILLPSFSALQRKEKSFSLHIAGIRCSPATTTIMCGVLYVRVNKIIHFMPSEPRHYEGPAHTDPLATLNIASKQVHMM